MLHSRLLTYVDEVARTGSIRKAATHLNVAASAAGVSQEVLTRWRQSVLTSEQPSDVRASLGEAFDAAYRSEPFVRLTGTGRRRSPR